MARQLAPQQQQQQKQQQQRSTARSSQPNPLSSIVQHLQGTRQPVCVVQQVGRRCARPRQRAAHGFAAGGQGIQISLH